MILTQTAALFTDAYRELNARKLFWITMALNLLAVAVFALLGINKDGVTFLHFTFESPILNSRIIAPEVFYKYYFTALGIPVWLSWVVSILALVSTAGMFPDLISGGVIETMLSRPISRPRLFLSKYLAGLLFVGLQVGVFSFGVFVVILVRGHSYSPSVLLAIPIVLAFFSYLFSVCALLGLVTRSTLAALLVTMLLWFTLFLVNKTNATFVMFREGSRVRLEDARQNLENQTVFADRRVEMLERDGTPLMDDKGDPITDPDQKRLAANVALRESRERVTEAEERLASLTKWSHRITFVRTVFPKTSETIGLLSRYTVSREELDKLMGGGNRGNVMSEEDDPFRFSDPRTAKAMEDLQRDRSLAWILGTSFVFESVVLGACVWIFSRRDF